MKVAILGFGTVGSGVFEVLRMNHDYIAKCAGKEVDVKYVLDIREFPGNPVAEVLVHDYETILNDPEIDVIAEVMGGVEPAYSYTKAALLKGKAVCTSNKELVSRHGAELLEIAKQNNTNYFFEASVGGGIPIIRPINRSLTADDIVEIKSIINGTTNYILTRMRDEGMDFDSALAEAQAKGFAERNPAADIEGLDAARKTSILASLVNQTQVDCEDIYTEGICSITDNDITLAAALKANIKLLSLIRRVEGKTFAMVAPFLIRDNCQLYHVNGVYNAVLVKGNAVGELMFYGSGAGKLPTASAVVADIVEAAKHKNINVVTIWDKKKLELEDRADMVNQFFVRVDASDKSKAEELFSIVDTVGEGIHEEFVFITDKMTEAEFEQKASEISVINRIRVDFE